MSAAISGHSRRRRPARAPARSRSTAVRPAAAASRAHPRRVRPADRRAGCAAQMRCVSSATVSSKRAANCSARSTRRLSSPNVARIDDPQHAVRRGRRGRRTDRWYSSVSGSQAIALMVKSRRRAASRTDIVGSPATANPCGRGPIFDSRRGSATSIPADLVHGKALADRFDAAEGRQQGRQLVARRRRRLRGRDPSTRGRAGGRAPSRRRRARARRVPSPPPRWRGQASGSHRLLGADRNSTCDGQGNGRP